MAVHVSQCTSAEDFRVARETCIAICAEAGWTEGELFSKRYLQKDRSRVWIATAGDRTIGLLAAVVGSGEEFAFKRLPGGWAHLDVTGSVPAEMSFLGVLRKFRGALVQEDLIAKGVKSLIGKGVTDVYAVLDPLRQRYFNAAGLRFEEVRGVGVHRKLFWGEVCFPARASIESVLRTLARENPELLQKIQRA